MHKHAFMQGSSKPNKPFTLYITLHRATFPSTLTVHINNLLCTAGFNQVSTSQLDTNLVHTKRFWNQRDFKSPAALTPTTFLQATFPTQRMACYTKQPLDSRATVSYAKWFACFAWNRLAPEVFLIATWPFAPSHSPKASDYTTCFSHLLAKPCQICQASGWQNWTSAV